MDAGQYNFAIAFQERIKISEEKMKFYEVGSHGTRFDVLHKSTPRCIRLQHSVLL